MNFINRIHEVRVLEQINSIVPLYIALEWGDGSYWSDTIYIRLFPTAINSAEAGNAIPDSLPSILAATPMTQLQELTAQLTDREELQEKINPSAIIRLFKELLPAIMADADAALENEIYTLFNSHQLYRTFDNNTF